MRLGIKAHWKDAEQMVAVARRAGATGIEVHLAPHDVYRDRARVVETFKPLSREFRLAVHQPFRAALPGGAHDFVINPAASQEAWRRESERVLADSAALAAEAGAEAFIVHPGGVEVPGILKPGDEAALARTLRAIRGPVPVLLENMPWFHNLGERVGLSRIGTDPESLLRQREAVDGYCLDVSHAYLGAPDRSLLAPLAEALGRDVRHVHASGARRYAEAPERGEGVPFSASDLTLPEIGAALARAHPDAMVVPEIKGGEAAGGIAFEEALRRLAPLLPA